MKIAGEAGALLGIVAIKMAQFNRYQSIDAVRAVCNSSRSEEIEMALYTSGQSAEEIVRQILVGGYGHVDR